MVAVKRMGLEPKSGSPTFVGGAGHFPTTASGVGSIFPIEYWSNALLTVGGCAVCVADVVEPVVTYTPFASAAALVQTPAPTEPGGVVQPIPSTPTICWPYALSAPRTNGVSQPDETPT